MKRTIEKLFTSRRGFLPAFLMLWMVLCAAPIVSKAQPMPRIINGGGPGMMPGGMPDSGNSSSGANGGGPWIPSEPLYPATNNIGTNNAGTNSDLVQLSFQGANIDMVVQWLAQTTGKTIVKHPQVQCQLTITSVNKVTQREAINIVYRALALEGYTVIESSRSILIVPEGKEPRMSPELVSSTQTNIPEGRQRLTKVFSLNHVQASQIMEKIRSALTDKATIDLDDRANQLIITDFNDNIRVVGELIDALDSGKPEDMAIRVIPLRHISGQDLAKELAPLYQKMSPPGTKDAIDVAADDRSNALIVFSSESSFNALEQVITMLDTEDAQEKETETFVLTNADAQDVAKQLQDLAANAGATSSRYVYYFSPQDTSGTAKKPSVVADRRRNAVIVQAPPATMESIRKMIEQLDAPVEDDSLAPKIYHLKYVSASDVEDVLNELFLKKTEQRSYYDYIFGDDQDNATPDRDVGRLYGKVRITSEPYSNTIIITSNSKENLAVVEDVLNQLDQPSEAGESTLRVGLRYGKAEDVAKNLNILFAKNGSPPLRPDNQQNQQNNPQNGQQNGQQPQTTTTQNDYSLTEETKEEGYYPWLGGQPDTTRAGDRNATRPVSDLVGRVRAVADPRINSLLISANVHFFPQILKLVDEMDAASDQVTIEARIVEVSSDFLDQLGVRWAPDGTQTFTADDYDNSLLATGTTSFVKGFGGTTTVNTPASSASASSAAVAQALTALRSGVLSSSVSMDFLIQFLKRTTDATVIGQPQITINDNETGKLFVGEEVAIPASTLNNPLGGQNTTVSYRQAGVTLEVTPHINSSGEIQLKVHVESSSLVANQLILNAPVFNSRQFKTDLTAKEGQTLVLGGIIQKQISNTQRKTPILGSIPGLSWLVNNKNKSTEDVELMVFLHPRVIRTPEDAADAMSDMKKSAPLVKKWEDDSQSERKK